MGLPHENYKTEVIEFTAAGWTGCAPLCAIANGLGLDAEIGIRINDDEVDAIICAMTGVASAHETLLGEELTQHVADILTRTMKVAVEDAPFLRPATGYVLLKSWPRTPTRIVIQEHATEPTL
jgi:hypothetical protein